MEKTKAILVAVTVCCLMTVGTPTFAGTIDGNQLLKLCLSHETLFELARRRAKGSDGNLSLEAGMCQGFVMGAMTTLMMTKGLCPPAGIHAMQAIDIVKLWLRNHPEARHLPGSVVVRAALQEKFPCK